MKIGVVGCAGRMGRMLVRQVHETPGCAVAGGVEGEGHEALGEDLGALAGIAPLGLAAGSDARALFAAADAVLEFTTPEASAAHAALAAETRTIHVIGTTGLTAEHEAALSHAAGRAAIVRAPNMSLAVNLLIRLTEQVAAALDDDYDIEIAEIHHRDKADAPSGTALALGRAAAAGRGVDLDQVAQRGRDGVTGPRRRGDIGFATLRGGDVASEHTVIFAAEGERVEFAHKASSREVYARGAVKAALWARAKPPGLYTMKDVLGL
ncbi:MAG: 4-hydroxy-tetrahydrodipicolinate reductase [Proteobacteria bacterium]|nr:4-hydroxy-tetrahydrodipicolinate reductase [Pseudomonadota bacterium]